MNLRSEGSFATFDEFVAFVKEAATRSGLFFGQILAETETTSKRKEIQFEKRKVFSATCLESRLV